MGEADVDVEDNDGADDLGQMLRDIPEDCESEKEAKNGMSDKAFSELLELVKNILPEGNELPETTYEAMKAICPLGLEVQKIHMSERLYPLSRNLSGQSNKGYKVCTHCMDETENTYLKHCWKVVYMGHRRFLVANHRVRKKGRHFEQKANHRTKPKHHNMKAVFDMVKDL
uniref:Transposon protein, putative, CACTA, En/Spm sub-class n=1 Tax=Oryza sativa subsp. japonica TaxID=39947 RepID=Q2QR78_ORYSJ|nr:transposon protein, putative, CACTA, En/Spm sub-class [Oryza sativa Japonica Group]